MITNIEQGILELLVKGFNCEIPGCNHKAILPFGLCEFHTEIVCKNAVDFWAAKSVDDQYTTIK